MSVFGAAGFAVVVAVLAVVVVVILVTGAVVAT